MRLPSLRRGRDHLSTGITGTARLDRRTRAMVKRLRPGDIAVIDHVDMDRGAAVALVDAGVAAVVNAAPSVSGRYPNLGPGVLLDAGIPLVDDAGANLFAALSDGDVIRLDGDTVYVGGTVVGRGVLQTVDSLSSALETSKEGMADQLEAFSANVIEHLRRERGLLLDGAGVPPLSVSVEGRQTVVVSRSFGYRDELAALKVFIKENSPVLIGVDGGADALVAAGHRPDVIVTDGDEISDASLRCGAELVAHVGAAGRGGSVDRLDRLGLSHVAFATSGTAEDAALLLAHFHGADLVVMVGSHTSLLEFLDKGRSGMASSFLTRAAVGSTVVDAAAVAKLYHHRVRAWLVAVLVVLGLALVAAAVATTPVGQQWWDQLVVWSDDLTASFRGS